MVILKELSSLFNTVLNLLAVACNPLEKWISLTLLSLTEAFPALGPLGGPRPSRW